MTMQFAQRRKPICCVQTMICNVGAGKVCKLPPTGVGGCGHVTMCSSEFMVLHSDKFELVCHKPYLSNHTVKIFSELPFACSYYELTYTANDMDIVPANLV